MNPEKRLERARRKKKTRAIARKGVKLRRSQFVSGNGEKITQLRAKTHASGMSTAGFPIDLIRDPSAKLVKSK